MFLRNGRLVSQGPLTGGYRARLVRDIVGHEPTPHQRPSRHELGCHVGFACFGMRRGG